MKSIKNSFKSYLTIGFAAISLVACQKSKDSSDENLVLETAATAEASVSDEEADNVYNAIFDNVMGVNEDAGIGTGIGIFGRTNGTDNEAITARTDSGTNPQQPQRCFTITTVPLAPNVFPKTITINFGNGCIGPDGRIRRGKIITVYTGRMSMANSEATTTFDNHFVDSTKVEGTHTVKNVSTSNNRSFNTIVVNGKLTRPSGNYIAWNKNKTWLQTEGNGTPSSPIDDIFSITGVANGTVKIGNNTRQWSKEILQPLIRKFTCRWIVKGQERITRNSNTGVIDFGTGNCDNQATLTINGNTQNITLH